MTFTVNAETARAAARRQMKMASTEQLVEAATFTGTRGHNDPEVCAMVRRAASAELRTRMTSTAAALTDRELIAYLRTQEHTPADALLDNLRGIAYGHELERRHPDIIDRMVDRPDFAELSWFEHITVLTRAVEVKDANALALVVPELVHREVAESIGVAVVDNPLDIEKHIRAHVRDMDPARNVWTPVVGGTLLRVDRQHREAGQILVATVHDSHWAKKARRLDAEARLNPTG